MEQGDKRELARKMAAQRSAKQGGARRPLPGAPGGQ